MRLGWSGATNGIHPYKKDRPVRGHWRDARTGTIEAVRWFNPILRRCSFERDDGISGGRAFGLALFQENCMAWELVCVAYLSHLAGQIVRLVVAARGSSSSYAGASLATITQGTTDAGEVG